MRSIFKYFLVVLLIIAADQGSKLWVHTHMELGPEGQINVWRNFLKLTYVLNYGMAFGVQFGFAYGKLVLTLFRIVASICITVHIVQAALKNAPATWIWGWAWALGGAIGNSIDSIFYGVYLDNAPYKAPMKWFHGQVIDMIHFDVWSGAMPKWLPIWGGEEVVFPAIFNLADVAVCIGFCLLFYSFKQLDTPLAQPVPVN